MFISEELIYIQMPKTGCTHIAQLLGDLFSGEQIGKHNAASEIHLKSGKYFWGLYVIHGIGTYPFGHTAVPVTGGLGTDL